MTTTATGLSAREVMTLEAFADTVLPGEPRYPGDRAIAGAATGGGAVACGAIDLLTSEEGGFGALLPTLAEGLDEHARAYADRHGGTLDDDVPAFVALDFAARTALAAELMAPGHPEQELWVPLAMFSVMAWDTGASMPLTEALAAGHPGLTTMGFAAPDPDGLWRFPDFSYRRALAPLHPHTTPSGDPA